ncbi:EAL domain-containing protein [Ferrovibrio sp.]|uniref:EAL domain-containing protein n=1 Tax=Ferrovibrio sp. TaxID=1917215 RepID=UPI0025C3751A|nr:EAL domain-containing protein [Ferrovibrio sp.]MBX3454728.1 EAL domain-containing protein [Ferrovibrio sp.]
MSDGTSRDMRDERDRFVAFAFSAADLLMEVGEDGGIVYATGAARQLFGCDTDDLIGRQLGPLIDGQDRQFLLNLLASLTVGARIEPVTVRLAGNGEPGELCVLGGCCLPRKQGRYYLALSAARLPQAETALHNKRDYQTGLLAVDDFEPRAQDRLRLARELGSEVKITLLEIVGLQQLAQELPGEQQAALMGDVGALLRAKSIAGDTAGRIAEDKYSILHGGNIDKGGMGEHLRALAARAKPDAAKLLDMRSTTLDLQAKGMSDEDAASAMSFAVQRFANQGTAGLNFGSTEESLKLLLSETVNRVRVLRSTVSQRNFEMVFQPIVGLSDRKLHHYEALVRFEDGGSPFETIRLAEGVHLIGEFDLAVVKRVMDTLAEARQRGERPEIAVNLSGHSMESTVFIAALRELIGQDRDLSRQIIFEVTESTQITDLVHAGNAVRQLRADGHSVCLDDFGAGAASFPYLQALEVDFVKIDGAYVKALQTSEKQRDRSILRGMVWLCKDLGIGTVAEMIETEEQARLLQDFGIDYGQGWLFGKPEAVPKISGGLVSAQTGGTYIDPSKIKLGKRT